MGHRAWLGEVLFEPSMVSRLEFAPEGLVFCGMLCGAPQNQEVDGWRRGSQTRLSSSRAPITSTPPSKATKKVWNSSLFPTDGSVQVSSISWLVQVDVNQPRPSTGGLSSASMISLHPQRATRRR